VSAPVCLITPPSPFLLDERVFVSLGILRVAAAIEQAGTAVEMVDLSGIENYLDAVAAHAAQSSALVFGLTATTPQLPAARAIIERLRGVRPDARVILGGPHVTLVHAARRREARDDRLGRAHAAFEVLRALADVLVAGDGERAVLHAIAPDAPAVIDADAPDGGLFLSSDAYEATPPPARHLVDMGSYHYAIDGLPATSLIAQLGCPFGCGFCGGRSSAMLRRIRTRSSASIIGEIETLHRSWGYRGFMFYDDELNVNRGLVELMVELLRLQERLGVEFRLRGFVKAELFTDEQAEAMYSAGFRWLLVGFEAGSPRILQNINKRATRDDNTRCLEIARRHGLRVKALMSLGHPGESPETVDALRGWLLETRPDDFDCTIITTYPGTPYYDEALPHPHAAGVYTYTARSGDRLHALDVDFSRTADYYKGDPNGGYRAFVYTDALSSEALVAARDGVERDVRAALGIPFNPSRAARRFEHSMGMGPLPPFIVRTSTAPLEAVTP
jgi:radical SAM superfamily enzyme YgiQ (UPF0313 family)